jgi:hypothetical protein
MVLQIEAAVSSEVFEILGSRLNESNISSVIEVGDGVGNADGAAVLITTPLFQIFFLPLLIQVNFFPW